MAIRNFLVRIKDQQHAVTELGEVVTTAVASSGCSQLKLEDFSLVMGEDCRYVSVEGDDGQVQHLLESWRTNGMLVESADEPVFELLDDRESGDPQSEDQS